MIIVSDRKKSTKRKIKKRFHDVSLVFIVCSALEVVTKNFTSHFTSTSLPGSGSGGDLKNICWEVKWK